MIKILIENGLRGQPLQILGNFRIIHLFFFLQMYLLTSLNNMPPWWLTQQLTYCNTCQIRTWYSIDNKCLTILKNWQNSGRNRRSDPRPKSMERRCCADSARSSDIGLKFCEVTHVATKQISFKRAVLDHSLRILYNFEHFHEVIGPCLRDNATNLTLLEI